MNPEEIQKKKTSNNKEPKAGVILILVLMVIISIGLWFFVTDDQKTTDNNSVVNNDSSEVADSKPAKESMLLLETDNADPKVGDKIMVRVFADSINEPANAVQANIKYDSTKLKYLSITDNETYSFVLETVNSDNIIRVARGTSEPKTGKQLVATIEFEVVSAGQTELSFADESDIVASNGNGDSILGESSNLNISSGE